MTHRNDFTKALRAADQWTRLLGQIMLVSLVGVILVILFTGTTKITERWLDPYLLALPLYITWKLKKAGVDLTLSLHKLMPVFIGIMLIVLVPLPAKTLSGGLTGSYTRLNLPFAALADIIKADGKPTLIIAKGMHLAGNMRMQFPDVPVIDAELPVAGFPPDGTVKGAILTVWLAEGDAPVVPAFTEGASSSASFVQQVARPYVFGRADKVLTLAYTWQR